MGVSGPPKFASCPKLSVLAVKVPYPVYTSRIIANDELALACGFHLLRNAPFGRRVPRLDYPPIIVPIGRIKNSPEKAMCRAAYAYIEYLFDFPTANS